MENQNLAFRGVIEYTLDNKEVKVTRSKVYDTPAPARSAVTNIKKAHASRSSHYRWNTEYAKMSLPYDAKILDSYVEQSPTEWIRL
jgi:hypothetical protein